MTEKSELKKGVLGVRECVMISIGGMVGIAVFVLSSITVVLTGPVAVLAWVVAGLLMFIIALNFTELATAFPRAGGVYVYPYETFKGKNAKIFFSFLTGWLYWFTFGVIAQVVGAIYIAKLMSVFVPGIEAYSTHLAVLFLIFVWILNCVGVVPTGITNTVLTFSLLILILCYVIVGLFHVNLAYYTPFVAGVMGLKGFLVAITIAWLGYTAWIAVTSVAEEVKEPQKTIPKALSIAFPICISFYFLILFVTFGSGHWTEFLESKNPFAYYSPLPYAATKFGVPWLIPIISIAEILAVTTTMLVLLLDSSRVLLAMGRTEILPKPLAYTHKRFKTPIISLTLLFIISVVMAAYPQLVYFFIQMGGGCFGIICIIISVSLIFLRRYRKDVVPSFRVPGGFIIPVLAILIILVAMTQYESMVYYLTIGWILCGCVYYVVRYWTKTGIFRKP
ncbi:hypothetical protein DRO26_01875 [Candidatus Bathyarchaeota archaeon]|nr:MAG: hypothetical protein DRO26_01875 [Candidatus Bathyarchaeota archaeon]